MRRQLTGLRLWLIKLYSVAEGMAGSGLLSRLVKLLVSVIGLYTARKLLKPSTALSVLLTALFYSYTRIEGSHITVGRICGS